MIRIYTGHLLNANMEKDFRNECPYRHTPLSSTVLRKPSVMKAAAEIYGISVDSLKSANSNHSLTCGDVDYSLIAELIAVPNRCADGSVAALMASHPFSRQPSAVRRRFFDFAVKKSVERDIDISFMSNSTEFILSIVDGMKNNAIQRGGVEIVAYGIDGRKRYGYDAILEIYENTTMDIFLKT